MRVSFRPVALLAAADEVGVGTHLVRNNEDKGVGALDGLGEVGLGDDVVAQVDAREVLDVLVLLVDDLGQLAALELRTSRDLESVSVLEARQAEEAGRTSSS